MNGSYTLKVGTKIYQLILLPAEEMNSFLSTAYSIDFTDKVAFIDYFLQKIFVKSDVHENLISECIFHEFLHAVFDEAGISSIKTLSGEDFNEAIIAVITPRLLSAFHDNSELFKRFNIV